MLQHRGVTEERKEDDGEGVTSEGSGKLCQETAIGWRGRQCQLNEWNASKSLALIS